MVQEDILIGIDNIREHEPHHKVEEKDGHEGERAGLVSETRHWHLRRDNISEWTEACRKEESKHQAESGNELCNERLSSIGESEAPNCCVDDADDDEGGEGKYTSTHPVDNEETDHSTS